MAHKCWRSFVN